jgi:sulfur-carrier protein
MPAVVVQLPSLLVDVAGCAHEISIEAATFAEALERLIQLHPALRVHLFDESGRFRQHVLCFHNEENTRWRNDRSAPLADGDTIRILQAVSGG